MYYQIKAGNTKFGLSIVRTRKPCIFVRNNYFNWFHRCIGTNRFSGDCFLSSRVASLNLFFVLNLECNQYLIKTSKFWFWNCDGPTFLVIYFKLRTLYLSVLFVFLVASYDTWVFIPSRDHHSDTNPPNSNVINLIGIHYEN